MVTSHQNAITKNEYELLDGWNNFVLFPISLSQEGNNEDDLRLSFTPLTEALTDNFSLQL